MKAGPAALLWAACALGCTQAPRAHPAVGSRDPSDATFDAGALPRASILAAAGDAGILEVLVEVAATDAARERGLMWRTHLSEGQGMLFVFPVDRVHSFWMKNTLIPLDMVFIDANGVVVGVIDRAEPQTLSPRAVDAPSRYVLEVPGGYAAAHGLNAGTRLNLARALQAARTQP